MILHVFLLILYCENALSLNCTSEQFTCKWSDQCVDGSKRCDGVVDCHNKEDELGCVVCNDNERMCSNQEQCIDISFWCDGLPDCVDDSDETDCKGIVSDAPVQCNAGHFYCPSFVCIPDEMVCNGHPDCLNGEDELNCQHIVQDAVECPSPNFQCEDKNGCIPQRHVCDGEVDCMDGSDETRCGNQTLWHQCQLSKGQYTCRSEFDGEPLVLCLDVEHLCDGKPQCPLGDDEGDFCKSKSCSSFGCQHSCLQTTTGPACYCKAGFQLNEDGKTCQDIDECLQYGVCDQICHNTQGGYECSCKEDYSLVDKSECSYDGHAQIYIAMHDGQAGEVRSYDLMDRTYMRVAGNLSRPTGLGYSHQTNTLVYTDLRADHPVLQTVELRNQYRRTLIETGLEVPEDLVIDSVSNIVYFTDVAKGTVSACNLPAHNSQVDVRVNCSVISRGREEPRGLALHTAQRLLFLTQAGDHPKIVSMSQDGKSARVIVSKDLGQLNGIFVDETIDRIFWADSLRDVIESANLDGSDRREVVRELYHPYGVVVFENRVYWTDFEDFILRSADKFTGNDIRPEELSYGGRMTSVYLHLGQVRHPAEDPCNNHQCSHLCLPSGIKDYTCVCPEGMYIGHDSTSCSSLQSDYNSRLLVARGTNLLSLAPQNLGMIDLETVGIESDVVTAIAGAAVANKVVVATADGKLALVHTDFKTSNILAEGEAAVRGLTHDNHNGNVFWIDAEDNTIKMMSEVTKHARTVVHCFEPLAVHYMYGKHMIVYVDGDNLLATRPDGNQIHLLASYLPKDVSAVTYSDKLDNYYFADRHFIYRHNPHQSGYKDVARVDKRPLSLVVQDQYLYWTEEGSDNIFWIDLEQKLSSADEHRHVQSLHVGSSEFNLHISATQVPIDYSMGACSTKYCSDICIVNEENNARCLCGEGRFMVQNDLWTSCQDVDVVKDYKPSSLSSQYITLIAVLCATTVFVCLLLCCCGCFCVKRNKFNPVEFINRSFGMSPRKFSAQEMSPVQTVKTGTLNEVYNPSYYSVSLASCPPIASSHTPVSAPTFSASFRSEEEKNGIIPGIIRSLKKFRDPKMTRIDLGQNSSSCESLVGAKSSSTPTSLKRRMETIEENDSACSLHSGQNSMEVDDISVGSDTLLVNKY